MFLYACNPLVLFEGPLGAHNDVFMSTLILWGLLLCFHADQRGFTRLKNYWPALVVLTLAALVKFTSIPLVVFFLLVLVAKTLGTPHTSVRAMPWMAALKNVAVAGLIFVVLVVLSYLPYWIGYSPMAILKSFGTPPSSSGAQNSIMKVATFVQGGTLISRILANRRVWSVVDVLAIGISVLVGAWYVWRKPSMRTIVVGSLATLAVILLVTPWFYSWYVVWLVALVPVALAFPIGRNTKALLAFCLTFSATAFTTYISVAFFRVGGSSYPLAIRYLLMVVPPIIVAIGVYFIFPATLDTKLATSSISSTQAAENIQGESVETAELVEKDMS
jgi:hypothetical protein